MWIRWGYGLPVIGKSLIALATMWPLVTWWTATRQIRQRSAWGTAGCTDCQRCHCRSARSSFWIASCVRHGRCADRRVAFRFAAVVADRDAAADRRRA